MNEELDTVHLPDTASAEMCCAACEARFAALSGDIEALRNQLAALEEFDDDNVENEEDDDRSPTDERSPSDDRPGTTHWFFRRRSLF